jgi:thioredoxin 1
MAEPFEVTDETFESEVLESEDPTLIDFWASWCAPCRMVAPVVEKIAEDYEDKLRVGKMDVDANRKTPMRFGISGIPTLLLFKDGDVVARIVGFRPKEAMVEEILPYLE